MGKFTAAMKAAKTAKQEKAAELELQKTVDTELQHSVSTVLPNSVKQEINREEDAIVSLTIKVPQRLRQHWQVRAKQQGTSVTKLIVNYLKQELGEPD